MAKALTRIMLSRAMHAKRPPTVDKLREAYPGKLPGITDIHHTAGQACGKFVVIDAQNQVVLVYDSALE